MSTFSSLSVLRAAVAGQKTDLGRIRQMADELRKKTEAANNKVQFRPDFIAAQVGQLRQDAQAKATAYLDSRGTYQSFANCRVQGEHWSVSAFLARSPGMPSDTNAWLKLIALQNAASKMKVKTLQAVADHSILLKDWASLGVYYTELDSRPDGEGAQRMLDAAEIPDCVEAKDLIAQSKQIEEFLAYSLKALSSGGDDLGVRMEASIAAGNETDAARARAMMQEEISRQNRIVEWQKSA